MLILIGTLSGLRLTGRVHDRVLLHSWLLNLSCRACADHDLLLVRGCLQLFLLTIAGLFASGYRLVSLRRHREGSLLLLQGWVVIETLTTVEKHGILIIETTDKVISIQKLIFQRLLTVTEVLEQLAEVLIPVVELDS